MLGPLGTVCVTKKPLSELLAAKALREKVKSLMKSGDLSAAGMGKSSLLLGQVTLSGQHVDKLYSDSHFCSFSPAPFHYINLAIEEEETEG